MSLDNIKNTRQNNSFYTNNQSLPIKKKSPKDIVVFNFDNGFNKILSENAGISASDISTIDENKDGNISLSEVTKYVKSGQNLSEQIMKKLAIFFGFEDDDGLNYAKDQKLVKHITNMSAAMQSADTNKNGEVSMQEIQNYAKLGNVSKSNKNDLTKMFGVTDSRVDNEQGNYGDCWLLTSVRGLSRTNPKLYNEIIKYDADNDSYVITFKGLTDPDTNKPVVKNIKREDVMAAIQKRSTDAPVHNAAWDEYLKKTSNEDISYEEYLKANDERNKKISQLETYGSKDPDAVAFELAFLALTKEDAPKHKKIHAEATKEYVLNTKFDTNKISTKMDHLTCDGLECYIKNTELTEDFKKTLTEEELLEFAKLKAFTSFKMKNNPFLTSQSSRFNFSEEQVALMKKYINNSNWVKENANLQDYANSKANSSVDLLYDVEDPIGQNYWNFERYLDNSNVRDENGVTQIPEMPFDVNCMEEGWNEPEALKVLTGANYERFEFEDVAAKTSNQQNDKAATNNSKLKLTFSSSKNNKKDVTLDENINSYKLKQILTKKLATKNPCFTSFKEDDEKVSSGHAYEVIGIDANNNVLLVNPHNSTKIERYPLSKFTQNVRAFEVSYVRNELV